MDQHVGRGQFRTDRVVIGHDQLEAQLARQPCLGHRRDAAIDGDNQRLRMLFGQPPQGLAVDPIAFLDPVRNVINHLACAGQLQAGPEDAGAADTVHVVIAVDDDGPVCADGPDDAFGRLDDARQRLGIIQLAELGREEGHGEVRLIDPSVDQQLGSQRRDPGGP